MFKSRDVDATQGPLFRQLILYAIPIAIGGLVQVLFNAADMIVLGNFASSVAVASVGATGSIVSLIVQSAVGLSGGTQVVLAHAYGERNSQKIRKIVDTSLALSVILGIILIFVGIACADWFLTITNCPEECFYGASVYLKIYFASLPAIMVYNYGSAIIRVSGDTQRPLYYLIAGGILNIVLNIVLCFILTEKVAAVAIATVASQVLGAVLVVIRLMRIDNDCRVNLKNFRTDIKILGKILMLGVPCALNTSLYSISNIQIQSAINSFGPSAMAGNSSSSSIESWVASFTNANSTTCLTFIGQNIGAKNPERVKKTLWYSLIIGFSIGIILGLGFYAFGHPILKIYLPDDPTAVEIGVIRMRYTLAIYFIAGLNGVLSSTLQAFGYSFITMMNSIFSVLVLRFFWMSFVFPYFKSIENIFLCYSVSWTLSLTIAVILLTFILRKKLRALGS